MQKGFPLEFLSDLIQSELVGDPHLIIRAVDNLSTAGPDDLSFFSEPKYRKDFKETKAGAIIVLPNTPLPEGRSYLIHKDPAAAFEKILFEFHKDDPSSGFTGRHPTAVIHQESKIGKETDIGPFVVIDKGCIIGDRCKIMPHTYIGPGVIVGDDCIIHPNVTIHTRCKIGNRVQIQSGSVIGSAGFRYRPNKEGKNIHVSHFGSVVIEDDVSIGSNTTIDQGLCKPTKIGRGTKIDSLVMIAHNVSVDEDCLIVAQTGVAGSSHIGKRVTLAAQVGVADHVTIEDNTILGARAGVRSDVSSGIYSGTPLLPLAEYTRNQVNLRNLNEYIKRLIDLEKQVKELSVHSNLRYQYASTSEIGE